MNRAERRAAEAAKAATEAVEAVGQVEPATEQPVAPKLDDTRQRMMEGLYEGRKKAAEKVVDPADMPPGLPPEPEEPTQEQLEAEEARKATKAREEAAKKQQQKDENKTAAPQQEVKVDAPAAEVVAEVVTTSKQKVDGVEYDVSLAEIEEAGSEKAWRLNKAAENRLAKTNAELEKTRQAQQDLANWAKQNLPQTPKPTADELFQKLAANRFGTDEEFAANLREVLSTIPKVDQNAIIVQATVNMKRDMANAQYRKEYSDVLSNPLVGRLAAQLELDAVGEYVANGNVNWQGLATLDWNQFYSKIGNQVRSVVGPRQSQPPATKAVDASGNPSQLSEKEARKASIVNLPTAAAARAVAPAEEKPETREQSIERMKRSRGIPTG